MARGGKRPGAGRPRIGRKVNFRLGDDLEAELADFERRFECSQRVIAIRTMIRAGLAVIRGWRDLPEHQQRARLNHLLTQLETGGDRPAEIDR